MNSQFKLDNPVWYSLSETQHQIAIDLDQLKCYHPDYCPFVAATDSNSVAVQLQQYAQLVDNFYLVGEKPVLPANLVFVKELVCLQMVIEHRIDVVFTMPIISLNKEYVPELFELVNLVQPGYFKSKTVQLGAYRGIFNDGQLVAVAGERMKMESFVEVSAIVTHPDHTGRGYAKQLTAHTANDIISQGKIPFLHVAADNLRAIKLYESLGFRTRRKISFWNMLKS